MEQLFEEFGEVIIAAISAMCIIVIGCAIYFGGHSIVGVIINSILNSI